MGGGGILPKEVGAVAGTFEGILSKEAADGVGTDAGPDWGLVKPGVAELDGGPTAEVTREGGVLLKSIGLYVWMGLETVVDTETGVDTDVGAGVVLEETTGAGGEGWVVTVDATDTVAWGFNSPVAELLYEEKVCKLTLPVKSSLADRDWVKVAGVGGLWVSGGLAENGEATGQDLVAATGNLGCSIISEANLLTVEVRVELADGALTTAAGVLGGAVLEGASSVGLAVIGGEDIIGAETLVDVTGVREGFVVAVGAVVSLVVMLVTGSGAEAEPDLTV